MDPTSLSSFDLGTVDPCARRRRRPVVATARRTAVKPEPVSVADPEEVARLGYMVAELARQLGEAQAANAELAERLDDHIAEPRREAEAADRLRHFYASRFQSSVG